MNGEPAGRRERNENGAWQARNKEGGLVAVVTVEQHALVVMVVVLIGDLLLPVGVTLPQLLVHHLLDLQDTPPDSDPAS